MCPSDAYHQAKLLKEPRRQIRCLRVERDPDVRIMIPLTEEQVPDNELGQVSFQIVF